MKSQKLYRGDVKLYRRKIFVARCCHLSPTKRIHQTVIKLKHLSKLHIVKLACLFAKLSNQKASLIFNRWILRKHTSIVTLQPPVDFLFPMLHQALTPSMKKVANFCRNVCVGDILALKIFLPCGFRSCRFFEVTNIAQELWKQSFLFAWRGNKIDKT